MESGNGGASSKGVLVPVSQRCDAFQSSILAPLKSAYLYEESKQSFRYKSAVLVQNPALEGKYNAFREKRREEGYSEEDLEESYGFLLFEDTNQANALRETGVLPGNSTCTTLGDPSKGIYVSMYSDCLDPNRWYHGKSGYIAIIRLTKGRVKRVVENYTQNFTAPTVGFDCHVSEQLPSVSSKTSSFLAFERTQYYMYELLDDGSNVTTQSPSAACPIAIISFSYTDTKAALEAPQEKSEEKKPVCQYIPWRGQLQIGTQFYDVGLRSTAGALIPAELPPVVEIGRAISMLNLRQLLPRAIFETCFSGEVFLDGLYFILCELVSFEVEETHSLALLLWEIKEKDLALTIQLNDGGFLILLHSSHFLKYDDTGYSATDVLQGMFVFPNSQVIQRDTKFRERKIAISSEILQALPVLSYAEGEVEKTPFDPSEEICEVLAQHMQTYASLINPGLVSSPTREVSIFPDQYDVPDAHKHLYSSPEWTNKAWQSFRSYLSKPESFQLPVSKASEILAAGQEERIEDLDDDVYMCLSSPEEPPAKPFSMESEDQLTGQRSPVNGETPVDSCITRAESPVDLTVPQNVLPDDVQAGDTTKDTGKSDLSVLNKTDDMGENNLLTPTSDDLSAELIVSITSAEQTITNGGSSMISTVSATKQNDFQLCGFPTAKSQTGVNCLNDESVSTEKVLDCSEVTNVTKTKRKKLRRGPFKGQKKLSKACILTPSLLLPVEDGNLKSQRKYRTKLNVNQRKVQMRTCRFRQLSMHEKVNSASVGLAVPDEKETAPGQQSLESTIFMDFEACPLRKKTERWDLKPVISVCGRILVPHGSVDFADQIKTLKDTFQSTKEKRCTEKMSVDTFVNTSDEMVQESNPTRETAVGGTEATTSKDEGNHLQYVVSDVSPEHNILGPSDDGKGSLTLNSDSSEHFSRTYGTATPPSEAVKERPTDTLYPGKIAKKGEFLLSKLKSVLLRGKRKTDLLFSEETIVDAVQDTEPCLKKGKVDSQAGNPKSNYAVTSVQDTNVCVKEVSKMLSVDPIFAYALGLTPKETVDKIQKTEGLDTLQEQTILDKRPQILHRPTSIFPRRGRIKTLKKHQGISTEYVKEKWWLHFQSPACFASEKLKFKECTRDNSVRKTVKEKLNSACSSTDALSLLADLALSGSNDQVPPQPYPALERKTETSLKKCDLSKDLTSTEQDSVLHSLLRQPAARPVQPLESTSPNHLVEGKDWVGLVSKEHAYSLLPSSSLLLGLPGTPFQVSPLSGSTRLLRHHQTMYGNGIKTLLPSVGHEDGSEQNHRTPEYLKKHMGRRRRFRHSRTFVNKGGSIQVTKQWKENYNFDLDSKFSNDSKDRTIVRALHGPWDFSMQDTSEEVRLIVHIWIGLFYSRTTSRFFHVDPHSGEGDSLSSEMLSATAQFELEANSFAPSPSTTDTLIPKVLDFSKKEDSMLDQGSGILDLSLRNTNAEIVSPDPKANRKETSASIDQKEASETLSTLKSSVGPQEEAIAIQRSKMTVHSTEIINEVNVRSGYENKRTCTSLEESGSLEHIDVPSCEGDETIISVREELERVSVLPENNQTAIAISHTLHGYNYQKKDMKYEKKSEATEMDLVQNHGRDSSKFVIKEKVDSNIEVRNVLHTVEHDESKDGENWEVIEKSYQEGKVEPSPEVIHANEDPTNEDFGIVCDGNVLENEKWLPTKEPNAVSPDKAENVNEDVDCGTLHCKLMEDKDHIGKEDGVNERNICVSLVETERDLSDKPVPMMCDCPDLVKTDCIIESIPEPPLDEQPSHADNKEDACQKLQLRKLYANDDCGTLHTKVMEDHIGKEVGVDERNICVSLVETDRDLSDKPVPMMCDCPDSVNMDCIIESIPEPPLDEQPSQADKDDVCQKLQLRKFSLCANGSVLTHANLEKGTHASSEINTFSDEPAGEKSSENYTRLADTVHYQKLTLPVSDDKCKDGPIPQTNDKIMADFNWSSDDHEDMDTKSIKGEQEKTTEKEVFHHQAHSSQCEAEGEPTIETDLKPIDNTNEALEKIYSMVVIPFIGIDTSGEDTVQPHYSHSQIKVEEVVKGQEEIPLISQTTSLETVLPIEVGSKSKKDTQKAELCVGKIPLSLIDASNKKHRGSESDEKCSTATMDEKPFEYLNCSASALTPKSLGRSSIFMKDEVPHSSTVNCDANPHHGTNPDLELRTLKVLQSIDKILSNSSHSDASRQRKTADMKCTLGQTTNPRSKNISTCFAPNHTSLNSKDKIMSNTAPAVVSASTSQELNIESPGRFLISPFKIKLEEVLGVKLQLQKTDSSVQHFERTDKMQETCPGKDCQPYRSDPSIKNVQAINPNVDHDINKTLNHEPRSYSLRPVMAVKPSQSDESQGIAKDRQIENAVMSHFSKDKQNQKTKVTYNIPTATLLVRNTESLKRTSEGVHDVKDEASELFTKRSLSNVTDSKSQDISKPNKIPSSLPVQSFESAKGFSKFNDGNQGSVEKVGQTIKKNIQMFRKDRSDASTSHNHNGAVLDDGLFLGPQSSLICTVYNTHPERSYSFLEQVSQRCIQDDPTEASVEQECLIFSEKMKHLLKRSKTGPMSQQDTDDKPDVSSASPVTVHFCSLDEREDSVDHLNTHLSAPTFVGQKIKVDLSERKDLMEKEKPLHLQNISPGTGNPMEHAGVSGVTSECARLYKAMMNEVCAVKKAPSGTPHFRMDRSNPKTEPGNLFDFCDEMKRELDKSFHSNLNSVVKKSCKTKYRFYILATSDDAFFEETKAQLEAEGHTAVQPSQFFLGDDSSSSLLIILRNEDIAEHICEVPYLLKLKTSPGVQFAGIDEPDGVVNLTHQELFTRGGFIMFDRAALEHLSLCNMKKMSEILQVLSGTGKWKWMMHYRDSRRLKENARLSAEAKEKKHFLNFCQESGLLEVLPYHECDLMSRDVPDYLTCLARLQVQNILARYPVFITDTTTDSAFGKNGILTMTFQSFLAYSPSERFTASSSQSQMSQAVQKRNN